MNDIADHEAQFHDHGEQVDAPYPQMSEHPLRTFLGEITASGEDGTYTITEQIYDGEWINGTAPGEYVGAAARDINQYTEGQVGDLILCWEQYTGDGVIEVTCDVLRLPPSDESAGNILYHTDGSGLAWLEIGANGTALTSDGTIPEWTTVTDELVGVDAEATPGYLGAAGCDGVLRVDCTLTYTDGGDWVTLGVTYSGMLAVDAEATPGYLGAAANDGILRVDSSMGYADGGDFITLSALDRMVASAAEQTPGYLDDVTAGHDPWIVLTEANDVLTWTHGGPGSEAHTGGSDSTVVNVSLDAFGHVRWIKDGNGFYGPEAP